MPWSARCAGAPCPVWRQRPVTRDVLFLEVSVISLCSVPRSGRRMEHMMMPARFVRHPAKRQSCRRRPACLIGQPKRSSAEGNFGILFLTFAENIFPPVPSEIIIPVAGLVVAREQLSSIGIVLAGTIGSLAGALFLGRGGRSIGRDRLKAFCARRGTARAGRAHADLCAGRCGRYGAYPLSPLHISRSAALDRALRPGGLCPCRTLSGSRRVDRTGRQRVTVPDSRSLGLSGRNFWKAEPGSSMSVRRADIVNRYSHPNGSRFL